MINSKRMEIRLTTLRVSKCINEHCDSKSRCIRYLSMAKEIDQTYLQSIEKTETCEFFIPYTKHNFFIYGDHGTIPEQYRQFVRS